QPEPDVRALPQHGGAHVPEAEAGVGAGEAPGRARPLQEVPGPAPTALGPRLLQGLPPEVTSLQSPLSAPPCPGPGPSPSLGVADTESILLPGLFKKRENTLARTHGRKEGGQGPLGMCHAWGEVPGEGGAGLRGQGTLQPQSSWTIPAPPKPAAPPNRHTPP
ncbi:hypothetical protein COCON_G00219990, partial [Conger conger]